MQNGQSARGIRLLVSESAAGQSCASIVLAQAYFSGQQGVAENDQQAVSYLKVGAVHGDPAAQYMLAGAYLYGTGAQRDPRAGYAWMRKSASQGYVVAEYGLGVAYENGIPEAGVSQNRERAVALLRSAAEQGNDDAKLEFQKLSDGPSDTGGDLSASARAVGSAPSNEVLVDLLRQTYRKFGTYLEGTSIGDVIVNNYNHMQDANGSSIQADSSTAGITNSLFAAFGGGNIMKAKGAQFVNLADTAIVTVKSRQYYEGNWVAYFNIRPRGQDRYMTEKMVVNRQDDRWVASLPAVEALLPH